MDTPEFIDISQFDREDPHRSIGYMSVEDLADARQNSLPSEASKRLTVAQMNAAEAIVEERMNHVVRGTADPLPPSESDKELSPVENAQKAKDTIKAILRARLKINLPPEPRPDEPIIETVDGRYFANGQEINYDPKTGSWTYISDQDSQVG